MEEVLLAIHNIARWGVVIFGLYAITKAALGIIKKQEYLKSHNISAAIFLGFIDLQLILGLILYFSRGWQNNFSKMGSIMGDSVQRFWTVEHLFGMLLGIILIHVGRTKSKKAETAAKKHKLALVYFSIGLLIILATIPWPFRTEIARALWP